MSEPTKCHAADRLAERYGVRLTWKQCSMLGQFILTPEAQEERSFLSRAAETYARRCEGISRWWINFEFLLGRKLWALAVVDERQKYIITFLPPNNL